MHTPGPWKVGQHPAVSRGWIVKPALFSHNAYALPECEGGNIVLRNEADARLIAAAPELLAELKHLVRLLEPVEDTLNVPGLATLNGARLAIQKAEGKNDAQHKK